MAKVPALELRGVSYIADGRKILHSVDWTVRPGEHWVILGPNGSGKTTLLKIACGYLWPNDGGAVYRKGRALINLPELRKGIGWVTSTLAAQIPVREKILRTVVSGKFAQIGLFEGSWGTAAPRDYRQAEEYLEQMDCLYLREQEFGTLSQGEQQKVLIARARMTKPYLIVLDEPCAGMDPGARENFLSTLRRVGRQKRIPSLIFVTHHIEEILPLFTRALVLKDGTVLQAGKTATLLTPRLLKKLYGAEFRLTKSKGRYWPVAR